MVFCICEGHFSEDYVFGLDVHGFGEIYKYLRRIEARRQINMAGLFRTANNATAKQYKEFINMTSVWLPDAETGSEKGTEEEFKKIPGLTGPRS